VLPAQLAYRLFTFSARFRHFEPLSETKKNRKKKPKSRKKERNMFKEERGGGLSDDGFSSILPTAARELYMSLFRVIRY
jgi:hypothetical protein